MLLSPQPFRVEVSGSVVAQPVRRCITHLLPVRPTCVGRTNLTSQGAPRSVLLGEPCDRQRVCQPSSYHPTPRGLPPGVTRFSAPFGAVSHPSAADRGLAFASTRAAQQGPKRDASPQPLPPFRPKLSGSRSHNPEQELAPRSAIPCPSQPQPTGASKPFLVTGPAATPTVRPKYAAWARRTLGLGGQKSPLANARAALGPKTLLRPAWAGRKRVYGLSAQGCTPPLRHNPPRSGRCHRRGRRCPPSQTRSADATQGQRRQALASPPRLPT